MYFPPASQMVWMDPAADSSKDSGVSGACLACVLLGQGGGAAVATMKKKPVAFGETKIGTFAPGAVGCLRFSTAMKRLRAGAGDAAMAAEFERDKEIAAVCVTHGKVADPVIGLVGDQVAFGCPWCSDPAILKAWEDEGEREKRS